MRRKRGEEGTFHETQTRGLNIDPWQDTRTNRDGLICEIRYKKRVIAKRLPALTQVTQSNLVSSPDMVIRLGDGRTGISAGRLTGCSGCSCGQGGEMGVGLGHG